jgi:hypothetical protein
MTEGKYQLFIRTWWRANKLWPGGLEPYPGKKRIVGYVHTEDEARARCREWNATHDPGRFSRKMEFTSDY